MLSRSMMTVCLRLDNFPDGWDNEWRPSFERSPSRPSLSRSSRKAMKSRRRANWFLPFRGTEEGSVSAQAEINDETREQDERGARSGGHVRQSKFTPRW
ncbi:MAG: hypothetical protein U0X92_05365 [Anaerolineales bacterium]